MIELNAPSVVLFLCKLFSIGSFMKRVFFILALICKYSFSVQVFDQQCPAWIKFEKVNESYQVVSASEYKINSENVLLSEINAETGEISKPLLPLENNEFVCSSKSKEANKMFCGGDFVNSKRWSFSKTEPNMENIRKIQVQSDYLSSPIIKSVILSCVQEYNFKRQKRESMEEFEQKRVLAEERFKEQQLNKQIAENNKYLVNEKNYEQHFRKNMQQGMQTNCGTIIEFKGVMAHVQTGSDAGDIWIKKDYLAPEFDINHKYIACGDGNRYYKTANGGWVFFK